VEVVSAGTSVFVQSTTNLTLLVLDMRRSLFPAINSTLKADLILVMTQRHRQAVLGMCRRWKTGLLLKNSSGIRRVCSRTWIFLIPWAEILRLIGLFGVIEEAVGFKLL
jgi:hypothetical protein